MFQKAVLLPRTAGADPQTPSLMQPVVGGQKAKLRRRDQLAVRDRDPKKLAFEVARPELEKILQAGEARVDVVLLPDIALQQRGVLGKAMKNLGGRQAVARQLRAEVAIGCSCHGQSASSSSGSAMMRVHRLLPRLARVSDRLTASKRGRSRRAGLTQRCKPCSLRASASLCAQ